MVARRFVNDTSADLGPAVRCGPWLVLNPRQGVTAVFVTRHAAAERLPHPIQDAHQPFRIRHGGVTQPEAFDLHGNECDVHESSRKRLQADEIQQPEIAPEVLSIGRINALFPDCASIPRSSVGRQPRRVKKLMRLVDGSISINRPDVPDNKRVDPGKLLAPDSMGKAAHYPCLDDSFPHDNALRIREARASTRLRRIGLVLTKLPLSPIVPSARRRRSN